MHFKNTHSCFYLSTAICLPPATNYSLGDSLFSLLGFATDLPAFEAGLVCSQWGVCFTDDCEIRSTLSLSLSQHKFALLCILRFERQLLLTSWVLQILSQSVLEFFQIEAPYVVVLHGSNVYRTFKPGQSTNIFPRPKNEADLH
jgi:hypothetical protein